MYVSFFTKCFLFHKFIQLSSRNIQVFRKACAKFNTLQNNSASWEIQMGFNSALKRLNKNFFIIFKISDYTKGYFYSEIISENAVVSYGVIKLLYILSTLTGC
jgi:hypothetical protein